MSVTYLKSGKPEAERREDDAKVRRVVEDTLADIEARGDADMTAFFLTDYLVRFFDALIWRGFGLDRRADMRDFLFGHYEKVVYLAQIEDTALEAEARAIAGRLALDYEYRFTGYGDLATFVGGGNDGASQS